MFCKKCGAQIRQNAKFCAKCGTPVPAASTAGSPPASVKPPVAPATPVAPAEPVKPVTPVAPVTPAKPEPVAEEPAKLIINMPEPSGNSTNGRFDEFFSDAGDL